MAFIAKQRYKLDIAPRGGWVIVYASQHDDGAREIEFEITNQGRAFSIPASINVSVQGIKSNGSYFSHSCSYSGNIVTMALADDMTDIIGKSICVLKFTNSSQQKLATAKFVLNVDTDSSSEGIIIDTDAEEIFNQMLNEIRAQAASISADIAELQSMVGSPLVASTSSAMTDHNKIYVYIGSESGYTNGNWYYWNGSAWTSGGVYNSIAFETDSTLTQSGQAADAKAVGDEISDLKEDLNNIEKYTRVSQEYSFIADGYINSSGGINPTSSAKNTGYLSLSGVKFISYKVNLSASAYGLAFFDSSKNFLQSISIAGGTSSTESTIEITETILQSAKYFVVSHYYNAYITWQPICRILVNDDTFDSRITALEAESENTLKTSDISSYIGLNRFDESAVIVGKEVYGDGSFRNNANSAISDYIDVTGGQYVYLKNLPTYVSDMPRLAYFYDENKNTTGTRISIAITVTEANFAIPSNAKYFVFSVYQRADSSALPIDYSNVMVTTEPTEESFIPHERYISSIKEYKIPSGGGIDISGLKVVIFGDSITETATMNDDGTGYTEGYRHNWPEYVNNYMKWGSFKNYAKSGASYKDRGSGYEYRQTVANQIALAMADSNNDDADIIVFSLGTNDGVANLGSYETAMTKTSLADLDQTNLYEALRYAYWTVRNKYKNAVCFSAIPIQRADIEPPTQLYEAIEKMAHRYDFIVINGAWQSGIIKENNVWGENGNDLYDGLHPNTTGQLKMAKLYASVMASHYLWNV